MVITLNSKEQLRLDIIHKLKLGKISFENAQKLLNRSPRTVYRYLARYEQEGLTCVRHKNSGKTPSNKTNAEFEQLIVKLCKEHYHDFNRTHAREKLFENHQVQINKDTFNRICTRNNILTKNIKRRKPKKPRSRRERMISKGLMIQLDGSPHRWFGTRKSCLIIAIDDATSDIIYGEFSPTETTFACMNVIKQVIKKEGLFELLYVDRAGIHGKSPLDAFSVKRESFSALRSALDKLNIKTIFAHSPQAKGRVERAFRTLQDRLVAELRLNNIYSMQEATKFLNEVFLPKHRARFALKDIPSSFTPVLSNFDFDKYFYMPVTRIVRPDNSFKMNKKFFDIETNGVDYSGKKVEIRSYPDGKVLYFIDDKQISLKHKLRKTG